MKCCLKFNYPVKLVSVPEVQAFYMKSWGVRMYHFILFKGRLIISDVLN
jgi:hypothetical protein